MFTEYSVGLMNQLGDALEAAGYTSDDVTKLRSSVPRLREIKGVLEGRAHVVDMEPRVRSRVVGTFTIACEGRKTSKLVKLGKYDWANDWTTDDRFPIQPHEPVTRTIELVECDYDPSSEEALEELKHQGLKRPTYEDALEFGVEHPEEQRKRPHIFLHEPVLGPRGYRSVLALRDGAGDRLLSLRRFGDRWNRYCVFAGVREG